MAGKKILIGGCSFSESQKHLHKYGFNEGRDWIPWTDLLQDEFGNSNTIINTARGSSGQSNIVSLLSKKLLELDFDVDMVVVQWSNTSRLFTEKESDLIEKIQSQGYDLLSSKGIDIFTEESRNQIEKMGYDITFNSLLQIYLFKNLLESKNIDYRFFWGWSMHERICSYELYNKHILNDKFLLFGPPDDVKEGGMHDYANLVLGESNTEVEDGHPNSAAHRVFYDDIIKPLLFG